MDDVHQAGMAAAGAIAEGVLQAAARETHGVLAHVSHLAAVAAERLETKHDDAAAVADVLAILREIQNHGHLAYLRQHGTEADYQKIGGKVRGRFQTPTGRWRMRKQ